MNITKYIIEYYIYTTSSIKKIIEHHIYIYYVNITTHIIQHKHHRIYPRVSHVYYVNISCISYNIENKKVKFIK